MLTISIILDVSNHRYNSADIDLDFPHWAQPIVMDRIYKHWPRQSARVSNFVTFKPKSALREACKRLGAEQKRPTNHFFNGCK